MKRLLYFFSVLSLSLAAMPLFAQSIPEIPYDSAPNLLKMPDDVYLGEVLGVATNSKGHIFVYTRSGSVNLTTGTNRVFVRSASRLFEFDQNGKYLREIGQGLYGFVQAHAVRVDPQDNIWVVDEGSSMVVKFDPEGRVVMTMGRKPEAIDNPVRAEGPPRRWQWRGGSRRQFQRPLRRSVGCCRRYLRRGWLQKFQGRQVR